MKLTLEGQIDALAIPSLLGLVIREIFDLLSIFESLLSRSSKDMFPFYLKHVELYRQLSKMLSTVSSRLESLKILSSYTNITIQFLIDSLEGLNQITRKIVGDSELSNLVGELEQIFMVFQEIRYILGQAKKRFKMYEHELYIAYDNKFVPRTNNDPEDFNNCLKRPIRKGQGKRES